MQQQTCTIGTLLSHVIFCTNKNTDTTTTTTTCIPIWRFAAMDMFVFIAGCAPTRERNGQRPSVALLSEDTTIVKNIYPAAVDVVSQLLAYFAAAVSIATETREKTQELAATIAIAADCASIYLNMHEEHVITTAVSEIGWQQAYRRRSADGTFVSIVGSPHGDLNPMSRECFFAQKTLALSEIRNGNSNNNIVLLVPAHFAINRAMAGCVACKGITECAHLRMYMTNGKAWVTAADIAYGFWAAMVTRFHRSVARLCCDPPKIRYAVVGETTVTDAPLMAAGCACGSVSFWESAARLSQLGFQRMIHTTQMNRRRYATTQNLRDAATLPGYGSLKSNNWNAVALSPLFPPCIQRIMAECACRHPKYHERMLVGTLLASIRGFDEDAEGLYKVWCSLFKTPGRLGVPSSDASEFAHSEYGTRLLRDVVGCVGRISYGCSFAKRNGLCPHENNTCCSAVDATTTTCEAACMNLLKSKTGRTVHSMSPKYYFRVSHDTMIGELEQCVAAMDLDIQQQQPPPPQ